MRDIAPEAAEYTVPALVCVYPFALPLTPFEDLPVRVNFVIGPSGVNPALLTPGTFVVVSYPQAGLEPLLRKQGFEPLPRAAGELAEVEVYLRRPPE